jgi:hypothetical protein
MDLCSFGCGNIAIKQFKNGKYCCSNAVSSCSEMKLRNGAGGKKFIAKLNHPNDRWKNGHPKPHKGKEPFNKGKTNIELYGEERALEIRILHQANTPTDSWDKVSDKRKEELREQARQNALKRHAEGWDNKAGRCKKYKYSSPIAGDVTLDGTWELAVAEYFDFIGYNWKRNTKRFDYIKLDGVKSHYTPDFLGRRTRWVFRS